MRPTILAFVAVTLVLATLAPTQAQSANKAPVITGFTLSRSAVDLIADRGQIVTVTVNARDDLGIAGMVVTLTAGTDRLQVALAPAEITRADNGTTTERWTGILQVDNPALLTGDWTARALVFDASGATALSSTLTFQVRAANAPALTIKLAGATTPVPLQRLGPGSLLQLQLIDPVLLRTVTYKSSLGGAAAPTLPLGTPFVVEASDLQAGNQTLTFNATDRLHRAASLLVPALVDTRAPDVQILAAPIAYQNLTTEVRVRVLENSSHSVILQVGDRSFTGASSAGGLVQFRFPVTLATLGNQTYLATATDVLGNRGSATFNVTVLPVYTEAVVTLTTSGYPVQGEQARFKALVAQRKGVTPLDFAVNITGPDTQVNLVATAVPHLGNRTVEHAAVFPPGKHVLAVNITAPPGTNVYNTSDLRDQVAFEVFLGRITYGTRLFVIRANAQDLPQVALEPATSKTYQMKRANDTFDLIYEIRLSSNTTLRWDADNPVVNIPTPTPTTTTKKGVPGLEIGVVAVLALVAAAFAARRR